MYRQGDVLLVPLATKHPSRSLGDFVPRKRGEGIILAVGEATGHHHRIRDRHVREYRRRGVVRNRRFVTVGKAGATVTHEEHDPLSVPQGTYEVVQQREYEPVVSEGRVVSQTRYVAD